MYSLIPLDIDAVYNLVDGTHTGAVYSLMALDIHAVYCLVDIVIGTVYSLMALDKHAVCCLVDTVIDAVYILVDVDTGAVYKTSSMPHACSPGRTAAAYYRLQMKAVLHVAQT